MKNFALILATIVLSLSASAQVRRIKLDSPVSYIKSDFMNSIYTISNAYSIQKYSAEGTKMGSFSFHKYGAVTKLDVTNPFQTVAFYKEGNKLVFLDMNLEKLNEIDLSRFPHMKVVSIAVSVDRSGVYLINENNNSLCKINANGDLVVLNTELPISSIDNLMTFDKNLLVIGGGKIILLDSFGQMVDGYLTQNVNIGELYKEGLSGKLDGKPVLLDFQHSKVIPVEIPEIDYNSTQYFISRNNIFVIKDNSIVVY